MGRRRAPRGRIEVRRRHLLLGCFAALGAGLFTGLGLHAAGALRNPCRGALRLRGCRRSRHLP